MMNRFLVFLAFCCWLTSAARAQSNDHMFSGQPVSKSSIDIDSHGFTINGKRTFIVSAGLEYARMPRAQWKDRLLRLKRGGFNCVEIYTFWNFHEPVEGKFEFSGDHDLDAFLKLVKELGMYCIARVGPYYCAEWDFGGYPHWLRFKKDMVVRTPDTTFMKYMDRFFDKLMPIIAQNQIHKGGSVILVQLENEHPASWGTNLPNEYFRHLQQTALRLGIEVPYFFSGMHHDHDPAGNTKDLFNPKRPSPWMSTEFWSVWFDKYGSGQQESDVFGRRAWKIITRGGNGYNVYMAYGGSNFGYTNNDEDAASYDYGAAVGQTGDLRPMYYQFKRNALFAQSFADILENSNATPEFDDIAPESDLSITGRTSNKGDIVSLDNNSSEESKIAYVNIGGKSYPSAGQLVLDPMEILPLVHRFSLTPDVAIDWAVTRILGIQKTEHTTTIVTYGKPGSYGNILFNVNGQVTIEKGAAAFETTDKKLVLQLSFSGEEPNVYSFRMGAGLIRVVAVDAVQADRTWFINENGIACVVVGPEYIGAIGKHDGLYQLSCERPWYPAAPRSEYAWIYDDSGEKKLNNGPELGKGRIDHLDLAGEWLARDGAGPAAKNYDDHSWLTGKMPQQMGADGDTSAYAWYRTTVHLPADDWYSLDISKGHGRYIVFLDGKKAGEGGKDGLSFKGPKGTHSLAVFSTHDGRDKLVSYIGKLDVDEKGLEGAVTLHKGAIPLLTHWKFLSSTDSAHIPAAFTAALDYRAGADAFDGKKGYGWFHVSLATAKTVPTSIVFSNVDDNAVVYINGQRVGEQRGWGKLFSVKFPAGVKRDSSDIDVFVENKDGRGGLGGRIKAIYGNDQELAGWRQKGGPGSFDESVAPIRTPAKGEAIGTPVFYRNYFSCDKTPANVQPMWRVTFEGLSHGFVWVNGHNLGRYPEVIPIDGLYIPECWLNKGQNEVVIFDEYGNSPASVKIQAEQAASRYSYEISE